MTTEKEILALKQKATELRDQRLQAETLLEEIKNNIANFNNQLKELGIEDPDKIDEIIKELELEQCKLYEDARIKIEKWMKV